nr:protein O-linked-mannose beta-1,4-N-acetylglucosaminyltransferase 2-like [Ipomoea batatas]
MEQMNGGKYEYEAILERSFSRQDRKTMGWCATLAIFVVIFTFCIFFKPYITDDDDQNNGAFPSPLSNLEVPTGESLNLQATVHDAINIAPQPYSKTKEVKPVCEVKRRRFDICDANGGDIRVIANSSTIFVASNDHSNIMSWNIRPYARKGDEAAMGSVRTLTVKQLHPSHQQIPPCTTKYDVPAVVFSTGGYAGNLFHDFTDLIIPLYLTSREFEGEVQFLVTDKRPRWVNKFKEVLQTLSKHEIIDLDREKDGENVFCFPRIIVGLKANKEFSINNVSSDHNVSMKNFTAFLRNAYNLKRGNIVTNEKLLQPPRLLVIARNKTRRLLNANEVSAAAENMGFKVVVRETDSNMTKISKFVNGFDVMVGVHGAGLSNMVFLPENAVVVQIVGLGMDWIANNDFEVPSLDMGLRYLGYKIGLNESSLKEKYPAGHEVLSNSSAIRVKGWKAFSAVYLQGQDVRVDVNRFRGTLLKALHLLHAN